MPKKRKINLALQGGGAHGAFTWGMLDRFLEAQEFEIEGISATSAGSMNAVILAQGMLNGGVPGARAALKNFWEEIGDYGEKMGFSTVSYFDSLFSPYLRMPLSFNLISSMINLFSPYEFNPFNIDPLKEILGRNINIEQLRKENAIKLFLCATNVRSGKIKIFHNAELSLSTILASACLPKLFQAVEVDNEYYWDGGYLGNPAIFPLIYETQANDILIMHVVPITRNEVPQRVIDIDSRLREISFNSSLMREMRAIAFVTKMLDQEWIKPEYALNLKKLYIHFIQADEDLRNLSYVSIFLPEKKFLWKLHDLGREAADRWLKRHQDEIGVKTTIDFAEWL